MPFGITLTKGGVTPPSLVLDNLVVDNSAIIVSYTGGETIFAGSSGRVYFTSWAMGMRYTSLYGNGTSVTGLLNPAPVKSPKLLDPMGRFFCRSRPQYEQTASGGFIVATAHNIQNDGTGDQTTAINNLLTSSVGKPIFFPAGIYQVLGTIHVPVNSIILGEGWSQVRTSLVVCIVLFHSASLRLLLTRDWSRRLEELAPTSMTPTSLKLWSCKSKTPLPHEQDSLRRFMLGTLS